MVEEYEPEPVCLQCPNCMEMHFVERTISRIDCRCGQVISVSRELERDFDNEEEEEE